MRVLIASDAWRPQINGVVRTLETVVAELRRMGHAVEVVHPGDFRTVACPTYPEIRLAVLPRTRLEARIDGFDPDALHIATEGPIGLAARRLFRARGWPFTTSFHTRFPEYVQERFRVPSALLYRALRWFHGAAERTLVATPSVRRELRARGFGNTAPWTRGVDADAFHPAKRAEPGLERPVWLYVGRLAVEKNLDAFLSLPLAGTKLVVGDGPERARLEADHPDAVFAGVQRGERLARTYASADVLVFPSRTDTFGLVMLEALASGTPVAAFPVPGPLDVVGEAGVLDEDLAAACRRALAVPRERCRERALTFSWTSCARVFLESLAPRAPTGAGGSIRRTA